MHSYTIHVDGQAYSGVDYDTGEPAKPGMTNGWEGSATPRQRDRLLWGGAPYVIQGHRNLNSHIARILERVRDGSVEGRRIVIEREADDELS